MSDEELSLATLDGTVHTIAALWARCNAPMFCTVRDGNRDLYDALNVLMDQVAESERPEPAGYPAELRIKDLEEALKVQHRRADALHHARKAWGGTMSNDADRHARDITVIAQAFERFLTDGTVHEVPDGPEEEDAVLAVDDVPVARRETTRDTGLRSAIIDAALTWVDESHTNNLGGPENWRNWADDKDVNLINAVLAYRGLPPLERKPM